MTRRQLWNNDQELETQAVSGDSQLEPEQVAAYLRQSSDRQTRENVESADLQLSGAQRYAVSQGLDSDKIIIAHEGGGTRGVSGTLRIDQRERLQEIMVDIAAGKIKVVWAYSVSRLFRDKYGVQSGTFIEACATHGVKVVIQTAMTFDFTNSFHVMMFQMLASVASRENDDRVKLLRSSREQKAMRGEYIGRKLTPGYIIDRTKDSATYGKYIPYQPHMDIACYLYRRFHEVGGQFNVLWHEVVNMPYVFPDFDSSVDQRDINQFRLTKVPGGFTMSRQALFNLLTSVEYGGYWKFNGQVLVDENGQPKKNHAAVVPMEEWRYAFDTLSFDKLTGGKNTIRRDVKATWKPVKERVEPLLCGLLTSPVGTIQYSTGKYKVMELRPGNRERSGTLMIDADRLDSLFLVRLNKRYLELGRQPFERITKELTSVKEKNAKALAFVDQQIDGYEKAIASKQAVLAALGTGMDLATMNKFNDEIKEARAILNDLLAKKNAASVEESQLQELHSTIDRIHAMLGDKEQMKSVWEQARRFIRLACEKIELSEYSAHFATLTVTWASPFGQTDIGYIWLANGAHEVWSDQEKKNLSVLYPRSDRAEILRCFPDKSWTAILGQANRQGLKRYARTNTSGIEDINLSLLDCEAMERLGFNPTFPNAVDMWVNDVSDATP